MNHPVEEGEVARVDDGRVTLVGKKTMPPDEATGEFIGLARFSARAAEKMRERFHARRGELAGKPYGRAPRFEVAYLTDLLNDLIDERRGDAAGVHRRRLARDRHRRGSRARQGRGELVKILIIDAFSEAHLEALRALGLTVEYKPTLDGRRAAGGDRGREHRGRAQQGSEGGGDRARQGAGAHRARRRGRQHHRRQGGVSARGIYVANCPGKNAIAVAELTMGAAARARSAHPRPGRAICAPARGTRRSTARPTASSAARSASSAPGSIGREVIAARARVRHARGRLVALARRRARGRARRRRACARCPSCAARADAVTLHVALAPETRGLIGEAALGAHAAARAC